MLLNETCTADAAATPFPLYTYFFELIRLRRVVFTIATCTTATFLVLHGRENSFDIFC